MSLSPSTLLPLSNSLSLSVTPHIFMCFIFTKTNAKTNTNTEWQQSARWQRSIGTQTSTASPTVSTATTAVRARLFFGLLTAILIPPNLPPPHTMSPHRSFLLITPISLSALSCSSSSPPLPSLHHPFLITPSSSSSSLLFPHHPILLTNPSHHSFPILSTTPSGV